VPLLGVLPGTGGLTRVTDKRHVRHDLADIFCTTAKACAARRRWTGAWWTHRQAGAVRGFGAERAARWPQPATGRRPARAFATQVERTESADALAYTHVGVAIDRAKRVPPHGQGPRARSRPMWPASRRPAAWWPLAMARELDDAILHLRTNELDIGTWLLKTEGDAAPCWPTTR
jgi:benzoyl-CoA-dihydrodiol lyase